MDAEFLPLLDIFRKENPNVFIIVDTDTDATDTHNGGDFDRAGLEGWEYDRQKGNKGWEGLRVQVENEDDVISLAYTSGTTARPKGVEYTHRGAYLASLGNVVESGLNIELNGHRAKYLWTLPMFHVRVAIFHPIQELTTARQMAGRSHGASQVCEESITVFAKSTIPRYGDY